GTTWRRLPLVTTPYSTMTDEWNWLSGAVVLNGRLYAGGVAAGFGGLASGSARFSVSSDHGFTWHVIEAGVVPAAPSSTIQAITPLDAHGSMWLRLVVQGTGQTVRAAFERSSDGGVTWSVVSRDLPVGGDRLLSAQLATDATHSGRVCASLTMLDGANVTTPPTATPFSTSAPTGAASQSGSAAISMPPPEPKDVSLLASDDDGATWHGGVVAALRRGFGGAIPSGVGMSPNGACYLATSQTANFIQPASGAVASFWRLAPGETQPTSEWSITSRSLLSVSLQPDGNGAARVIALSRISGPGDGQKVSCGAGCYTARDGGVYRLIWQPAPRS
ncbi:MAG TPA: sialidase family protein, partial [Ktedonobacterales bacterium]|nr:sialidase family protein [Ktedonobacterales bacterium]